MSVHNKRYQASFYQFDFKDLELDSTLIDSTLNRVVWFMIDEQYGEYRILMYYDNKKNQANGEDL